MTFNLKTTVSTLMLSMVLTSSAQSLADLQSDTWVGIDGIKRVMPGADEAPLKTDKERIVSIFYVSWHTDGYHTSNNGRYGGDVTKVLQKDPEARKDMYNPAWEEYTCHWGEPEEGYFLSADPYIIRKDISMLNDAGVDLLVLDCTNGVRYVKEWDTLLSVLETLKAEGSKTPKVCWWVYNNHPTSRARNIYDYYYTGSRFEQYKDFYFYLDGKPLLLCNMRPEYDANQSQFGDDTGYRFEDYTPEVINFFTMRNMWWGYYNWPLNQTQEVYVGGEDHWTFGYDMHDIRLNMWPGSHRASYHNGEIEQMSVTPAQHAVNMVGKSYKVATGQPNLNEYDLPKPRYDATLKMKLDRPHDYGIYFQERWNEALATDPKIVFINDWNEWIAGMFGGGPYDFMGRTGNNFRFVDQYNAEFNRTVMPMKDGYTDNYYMQMVQNIRKYKGVRQAPVATSKTTLRASSAMTLWDDVAESYFDTYGDVAHRDYNGYGGMHYVNTTGRNDFVNSKVAVDNDMITFYVQTDKNITPRTDNNWMLLFINTDRDFSTGWGGFDFIVNKSVVSDSKTTLMQWNADDKDWEVKAVVDYRVEGNKMVVEIPLSLLSLDTSADGGVYFKWADNPADLKDPISLCYNGDTAPNRRFCYDYSWKLDSSGIDETLADTDNGLRVVPQGSGLFIETSGRFTVTNVSGVVVAQGQGSTILPSLDRGLYIVSNGRTSVKCVL